MVDDVEQQGRPLRMVWQHWLVALLPACQAASRASSKVARVNPPGALKKTQENSKTQKPGPHNHTPHLPPAEEHDAGYGGRHTLPHDRQRVLRYLRWSRFGPRAVCACRQRSKLEWSKLTGRLAEKEARGVTKQDGRARRAEACTRVWLQAHTSHCGKASKHVGLTHRG